MSPDELGAMPKLDERLPAYATRGATHLTHVHHEATKLRREGEFALVIVRGGLSLRDAALTGASAMRRPTAAVDAPPSSEPWLLVTTAHHDDQCRDRQIPSFSSCKPWRQLRRVVH